MFSDECTIKIQAVDGGGLSGNNTITIIVQDVDDNEPHFAEPKQRFAEIEESSESNTIIYGIEVSIIFFQTSFTYYLGCLFFFSFLRFDKLK